MEPVPELPSYCRGLDALTDTDVRVPQHWSIGPSDLLLAGGHVAMVRPTGTVLRVFDAAGECRGTFASWSAARSAVFALVTEWEAEVDLDAA